MQKKAAKQNLCLIPTKCVGLEGPKSSKKCKRFSFTFLACFEQVHVIGNSTADFIFLYIIYSLH